MVPWIQPCLMLHYFYTFQLHELNNSNFFFLFLFKHFKIVFPVTFSKGQVLNYKVEIPNLGWSEEGANSLPSRKSHNTYVLVHVCVSYIFSHHLLKSYLETVYLLKSWTSPSLTPKWNKLSFLPSRLVEFLPSFPKSSQIWKIKTSCRDSSKLDAYGCKTDFTGQILNVRNYGGCGVSYEVNDSLRVLQCYFSSRAASKAV
jgi:hypothetical protein